MAEMKVADRLIENSPEVLDYPVSQGIIYPKLQFFGLFGKHLDQLFLRASMLWLIVCRSGSLVYLPAFQRIELIAS